jgi:hypothetical protein
MPLSQHRIKWRSYETRGQPIHAQGQDITPIGRVMQIGWPRVGLIWHRPVAVEVRRNEGVTRLPIRNRTRRAIAFFSVGLSASILALTLLMQRRNLRERTSSK